MIDWDDVRYFLAAARGGSVRGAAKTLGVNHATVLRRIAQLEKRLGAQMFERLPSGYRLTPAGEEVLEFAEQMEASSHQLEMRVLARDQSARGLLRVTLPPFLAIRIVMDRKNLPLNLHGLKGPELSTCIYVARDRLAAWRAGPTDPVRPIVVDSHGIPDWADEGEVGATGIPFRTPDADAQIAAARQGIGITRLPCFVGDADRLLARVPGVEPKTQAILWLLTQGEARKT